MREFTIAVVTALAVTLAVVLAADAMIGALAGAMASVAGGPGAPWWITGHLVERVHWLVFALLLGAVVRSPLGVSWLAAPITGAVAWRLVGLGAMVVPLLWIAALWVVRAAIFTVFDRWGIDGQGFLSVDYYRSIAAGYVPWLLGGLACLMASRHVP